MSVFQQKYFFFLFNAFWLVLSVIFFIYPALQNGYPLLHPDSGAYIYFGFLHEIPVSRPITYCWLIRHISMWESLWLVVILQGLLMTSFINIIMYKLLRTRYSYLLSFLLIAILSFFTGLPVYISHLMPDIYLGIAFLGYFLLLTESRLHWIWILLISQVTFYSTIVHFSNLPVLSGTVLAATALSYLIRKYKFVQIIPKRLIIVGLVLLLSWLSIPTINASYGIGFKYSRVSNIVFTARLIMPGIFADYVAVKCEEEADFFLCDFKNEIPAYDHYEYFLWHDTSFLYKHECEGIKGFADCWLLKDSIYGTVVDDIMHRSKYQKWFLKDAAGQYWKQLHTFDLGTNPSFGEKSHINYPIKKYYPKEHQQYLEARQQVYGISWPIRNLAQKILVAISLVFIILFFSIKRLRISIPKNTSSLVYFYLLLVLANAGLISILSIVTGRFQGRIIWMLPMLAFILIAQFFLNKKKTKELNVDGLEK